MTRSSSLLFALLILSSLALNNAFAGSSEFSCNSVAKQMYLYSSTKKPSSNDEPWREVAWLKNKIGEPTTKQSIQKSYKWDKLLITVIDGKTSVLSMNTDPHDPVDKKISSLSANAAALAKAIRLLGEPKKIKNNEITSYKWNCINSKSDIAVNKIMDKTTDSMKNTIMSYTGHYCEGTHCKSFKIFR